MVTIFKSVENMKFNGIDLADRYASAGGYFVVNNVRGRGVLGSEIDMINVPGRDGSYVIGKRLPPRPLEVDITLKGDSYEDLRKKIEDLNALLSTETDAEIVFDDEPDRVYYGRLAEVNDKFEKSKIYQATLTFICPDPYKYGPEKEAIFPSDVVSLPYKGTAPGDPIFELEATQPVTFAMIQNQETNEYMMIGRVPSIDQIVYDPLTTILNDELTSTVGWTKANFPLDPNVLSTLTSDGVITSDGSSFFVQNYGTGSSLKWYGPGVVKSLSEQLENYRIAFRCRHEITEGNSYGRTELYFLDSNSIPIAKMSLIKDGIGNVSTPEVSLFDVNLNKRSLIKVDRQTIPEWKNVDGYFLFEKNGSMFTVRAMKTRGYRGRVEASFDQIFNDREGIYQRKVAYIGIVMMKYTTYPSLNRNRAESVLVQKINQQEGIPYIAQPGDKITFDHVTKDILINGESRKDLKDFGARFFHLQKGENQFVVLPSNSFATKVRYRERFL